jgi:glyoxylase-like metal-dependent hydrolase (beta-lactamase superfamily II)
MRVFHIPSARTLLAGDLVYNRVHLLTADVGHIDGWIAELERVRDSLDVDTVIMGHGRPCGPEVFDTCIEYLQVKKRVAAPKVSVAEVAQKMHEAYPDFFARAALYWTRGPGYGFYGPEALGMPADVSPVIDPPS